MFQSVWLMTLSATDMQTNVCQIDMQSRINVTDVRETSKLLLICQLRPQYIMVKLWSVKTTRHQKQMSAICGILSSWNFSINQLLSCISLIIMYRNDHKCLLWFFPILCKRYNMTNIWLVEGDLRVITLYESNLSPVWRLFIVRSSHFWKGPNN